MTDHLNNWCDPSALDDTAETREPEASTNCAKLLSAPEECVAPSECPEHVNAYVEGFVELRSMVIQLLSKIDCSKYPEHKEEYHLRQQFDNIALQILRYTNRNSNYLTHLNHEYSIVFNNTTDEMQLSMQQCIADLLCVFSSQGHSGTSAPYCARHFHEIANFKPISPLTGEDNEWMEIGENCYQNRRCSHVFKDETGTYDIYGKVFREPNGCCFNSSEGHVYIEFPYTPKTEYVDVPAAEDRE